MSTEKTCISCYRVVDADGTTLSDCAGSAPQCDDCMACFCDGSC